MPAPPATALPPKPREDSKCPKCVCNGSTNFPWLRIRCLALALVLVLAPVLALALPLRPKWLRGPRGYPALVLTDKTKTLTNNKIGLTDKKDCA